MITLGIIGVVAALTMPLLIAKYQQKTFETSFKKQYSVLNNAINYIVLNEGIKECYVSLKSCPTETNPNNYCYTSANTDCNELKNHLIKDLKLTAIKNDFIYNSKNNVLNEGGVSVNSSVNYDANFRVLKPYMLPDGAVLFLGLQLTSYEDVQFVIDVNGKKGPNRWGYDVFWLCLRKKDNILRLSDEYSSLSEKGGSLPRNILMNKWGNEFKGDYGVWN